MKYKISTFYKSGVNYQNLRKVTVSLNIICLVSLL